MCDELRWCGLGCYGHPTINTPNIDALAARGVRFQTAVSNNPVCMPARSLLVAGQYSRTCCKTLGNAGWPGVHGASKNIGFPQWPTEKRQGFPDATLPETLRDAGYNTAAIGKWHIEAWPDQIGFDNYIIPAHHHAHSAQWFCEDGGPIFSPPGYSVDYEADRVQEFILKQAKDQQASQADADADSGGPFFLYYNISPPHMPLADAPRKYLDMYKRADVVTRPNVPDGFVVDDWQLLSYLWDYRAYRDHLPYAVRPHDNFDRVDLEAYYMGLTTWVDDTVGKMMDALAGAGIDDNTVVLFTSDHGDNFGSHGRMGKGSFNDEGCRVPFCVAGPPELVQGKTLVTGQVASLVDIAPTFLSLAGADTPGHMPGQDLCAVLRGEAEALAEPGCFIETTGGEIGIRTPTHTLALRITDADAGTPADAPHTFWDTVADPYQMNNLAGAGEQAAAAAALEARVRAWHASTPRLAR